MKYDQVEIRDVELRELTSKAGDKYFKQTAWFHQDNQPYPLQIQLFIKQQNEAYKTGFYDVVPTGFVDRFQGIQYRTKLVAAK